MNRAKLLRSVVRTAGIAGRTLPFILGIFALASLLTAALPPRGIVEALPMESVFGPIFGAIAGSVAAGNPVTSYVLAGELSAAGAGVATITALVVSWVTVGIVQLPAEIAAMGARFALWRNALCFVLAIAMAYFVAALVLVTV